MTDNVVIYEVEVLLFVVLSKTKIVIYEVEVLLFVVLSKAKIACLVGNQLVPPNV